VKTPSDNNIEMNQSKDSVQQEVKKFSRLVQLLGFVLVINTLFLIGLVIVLSFQ